MASVQEYREESQSFPWYMFFLSLRGESWGYCRGVGRVSLPSPSVQVPQLMEMVVVLWSFCETADTTVFWMH